MSEELKIYLRESGLKVTAPRMAVFRFLTQNDPSPVAAIIEHHAQMIDRASIYRTVALFRKIGIIRDIVAGGRRMIELTDQFGSHHHHISCLQCGKSRTVDDRALESDLARIADSNGFRPVSHQIEMSGICADCQTG
ncbi:MAG: Fur family transcriptional regulator [Thermoleophilia bacterium]